MAKKKKAEREKCPVPTGHDYRGKECCGKAPQTDCKAPDGISGDWGDFQK